METATFVRKVHNLGYAWSTLNRDTHWQIKNKDGLVMDIWPTTSRYRWADAEPGTKASKASLSEILQMLTDRLMPIPSGEARLVDEVEDPMEGSSKVMQACPDPAFPRNRLGSKGILHEGMVLEFSAGGPSIIAVLIERQSLHGWDCLVVGGVHPYYEAGKRVFVFDETLKEAQQLRIV